MCFSPTMKQAVSGSQSKNISEDANADLKSILAGLCESMHDVEGTVNEVKGTMESFSGEMRGGVKNLEAKIANAFNNEGLQRKPDHGALHTERREVYDELTNVKDEMKAMKMGRNCTVSSATSTHSPMILALQETKSWGVENLSLSGFVEKICIVTKCLQERFMGRWRLEVRGNCEIGVLTEARCWNQRKG